MKRLISILFLLSLSVQVTLGALTYRYVTDAGAGAADGTSIANAMSYATFTDYMVTGGSFTAAPGDVFRIIGAITSRTTTTDTWLNGGNSTSPVVVEGWTSGGATAYAGRTNYNGPLITTDFPTIAYTSGRLNVTGTFIYIRAISFSGTGANAVVTVGQDSVIQSCTSTNSSTSVNALALTTASSRGTLLDCDASMTGASGGNCAISALGIGSAIDSCRVTITSSGAPGIICTSSSVVIFNTVYTCGGVGIYSNSTSGSPYLRNNTVYGCGADGIDVITGTTVLVRLIGNMITDNGGYGVDFNSTAVAGFVGYNRTRDNTSGAYNSATDWVAATSIGNVTTDTGGASTDYVNAGSGDLNLTAASPATSVSLPKYASMGAVQRGQTNSGIAGGQRSFAIP